MSGARAPAEDCGGSCSVQRASHGRHALLPVKFGAAVVVSMAACRAAALKHWEREGRHHDSYSPEAIKRRRDMPRTTKEPWDLIAQAEALIESKART